MAPDIDSQAVCGRAPALLLLLLLQPALLTSLASALHVVQDQAIPWLHGTRVTDCTTLDDGTILLTGYNSTSEATVFAHVDPAAAARPVRDIWYRDATVSVTGTRDRKLSLDADVTRAFIVYEAGNWIVSYDLIAEAGTSVGPVHSGGGSAAVYDFSMLNHEGVISTRSTILAVDVDADTGGLTQTESLLWRITGIDKPFRCVQAVPTDRTEDGMTDAWHLTTAYNGDGFTVEAEISSADPSEDFTSSFTSPGPPLDFISVNASDSIHQSPDLVISCSTSFRNDNPSDAIVLVRVLQRSVADAMAVIEYSLEPSYIDWAFLPGHGDALRLHRPTAVFASTPVTLVAWMDPRDSNTVQLRAGPMSSIGAPVWAVPAISSVLLPQYSLEALSLPPALDLRLCAPRDLALAKGIPPGMLYTSADGELRVAVFALTPFWISQFAGLAAVVVMLLTPLAGSCMLLRRSKHADFARLRPRLIPLPLLAQGVSLHGVVRIRFTDGSVLQHDANTDATTWRNAPLDLDSDVISVELVRVDLPLALLSYPSLRVSVSTEASGAPVALATGWLHRSRAAAWHAQLSMVWKMHTDLAYATTIPYRVPLDHEMWSRFACQQRLPIWRLLGAADIPPGAVAFLRPRGSCSPAISPDAWPDVFRAVEASYHAVIMQREGSLNIVKLFRYRFRQSPSDRFERLWLVMRYCYIPLLLLALILALFASTLATLIVLLLAAVVVIAAQVSAVTTTRKRLRSRSLDKSMVTEMARDLPERLARDLTLVFRPSLVNPFPVSSFDPVEDPTGLVWRLEAPPDYDWKTPDGKKDNADVQPASAPAAEDKVDDEDKAALPGYQDAVALANSPPAYQDDDGDGKGDDSIRLG